MILNLSENPIKFSNIHDLDALIPDEPDRPLTWADIIAEEPLEGDIWVEPDYEEDSDLSSIEDEIETEVDEPGSYAGEKAGKEVRDAALEDIGT